MKRTANIYVECIRIFGFVSGDHWGKGETGKDASWPGKCDLRRKESVTSEIGSEGKGKRIKTEGKNRGSNLKVWGKRNRSEASVNNIQAKIGGLAFAT